MIATKEDMSVIDGTLAADFNRRIAAVWAHAHDLAVERIGAENAPGCFVTTKGNALIAALEAADQNASVADMLAIVDEHIPPRKES